MKIWIRADGNEEIASGHLRRMLSVAEALRGKGCEVQFLLADDESRARFLELTDTNRNRWTYVQLGLPYGSPMEELPVLRQLISAGRPDWLLVDSYSVTEEFFAALSGPDFQWEPAARISPREAKADSGRNTAGSGRCRIAFMDDLMQFDPGTDMVINYAPGEEALRRFYRRADIRLLGPRYAPLRQQFSGLEPQLRGEVSRVLVTTGGSDPFGMAKAVDALLEEAGLDTGIAAPGYPYVENMAALMRSCDLAVSAGGTTLYELCAAGVPTLCFTMADNQVTFAGAMAEAGACTLAGDVRTKEGRSRVLKEIIPWVTVRSDGEEGLCLRKSEAERMHRLTDGLGAQRIADALLSGAAEQVR